MYIYIYMHNKIYIYTFITRCIYIYAYVQCLRPVAHAAGDLLPVERDHVTYLNVSSHTGICHVA